MKLRILHLGAGIQSATIYHMMHAGEIELADYALFADTQEEPKWVYKQLKWLEDLNADIPIRKVTAGKIGDDLAKGRNTTGGRFTSIPAHTTYEEGKKGGITRRQCTREYKIEPIEKWVRRMALGLKPGQRIPKGVHVISIFGFSTDESRRAVKMNSQSKPNWTFEFPLFDEDILFSRLDCQNYIERESGFGWKSSRCVFCPLQGNHHWREIKESPEDWERAVQVDRGLREEEGARANRDMNENMYVHRACRPLDQASLDEGQDTLFDKTGCDNGCFL